VERDRRKIDTVPVTANKARVLAQMTANEYNWKDRRLERRGPIDPISDKNKNLRDLGGERDRTGQVGVNSSLARSTK
jgi:hypothetical protein